MSADQALTRIEREPKQLFKLAADGGRLVTPLVMNYPELRDSAGDLTWIVKRLFPANSVGIMFGASGTFKSFVAIDAAMHIAHGIPWLGQKTKKGDVVYLAAEGGVGVFRRITAWHSLHNRIPEAGRYWFVTTPLELLMQAQLLREEIAARKIRPRLIVIDTMSQTFSGEENSNNDVAEFLRSIRIELAQAFDACVLIIHHAGHSTTERPRGSSAIKANTDFLFGVFRDEKELACTLENHHQKDGELFRPATFDLKSVQIGLDEDGDPITSLVARELGSVDEFIEKIQSEVRSGRGSNNQILHSLCTFDGQTEEELRNAFYAELGKDKTPDTKRRAFNRSKDWLVGARMIDIEANRVLKGPKWGPL